MSMAPVEQIAADIDHLSLDDQLWLMERIVHNMRQQRPALQQNGAPLDEKRPHTHPTAEQQAAITQRLNEFFSTESNVLDPVLATLQARSLSAETW